MKIILIAVAGSGKGTIMGLVKKELPDVETITFGDFMWELAQKMDGIKDRDEMKKKFSIEKQTRLQALAAKKIAEIPGNVLINTHATIKTPYGYWPGLPTSLIKEIKPDVVLVVEYNPDDIAKRRKIDEKIEKAEVTPVGTVREPRPFRYWETSEEIELQQELNRDFAIEAVYEAACPIKIVDLRHPEKEEFGHAKEAAKEIVGLFKKVK